MTDPEQLLTDALTQGARGAPSAIGLAAAARDRARQRRRARVAGGAVLAVLAVGIPTAVVAVGGDQGEGERVAPAEQGTTAVDPNPSPSTATDPETDWPMGGGYRWESWHGVSVRVPKTWEYGSMSDWCADGGELTPRVQRPGTASHDILCEPGSTYGVSFQAIDNTDDFEWPVVHQNGGGWPEENYVGGRGIGAVLVMAATPEPDQARFILDSMRAIGPEGDPNGCPVDAGTDPVVPEDAMTVCRYDDAGLLEQSELLSGADLEAAETALQAAPAANPKVCDGDPGQTFRMASVAEDARIDLNCNTLLVDGEARELTEDVLYWALSPGWSGTVPGDVSLPSGLR